MITQSKLLIEKQQNDSFFSYENGSALWFIKKFSLGRNAK